MGNLPPFVSPGQVLAYDARVVNASDPKRLGRIDVLASERCPAGPIRRIPPLLPPGVFAPATKGQTVVILEFPGMRMFWVALAEATEPRDWSEAEPRRTVFESADGRLQVALDPASGVVRLGRYDADRKVALADPLISAMDKVFGCLTTLISEMTSTRAAVGLGASAATFGTAKTDTEGGAFRSEVVLAAKELP